MVVRMRSTRSHTANRRSHFALKESAFSVCGQCGGAVFPHTVCRSCGHYRGRQVLNLEGKLAKKERKRKEKEKVLGKGGGG